MSELQQADRDVMLLVEAFSLDQQSGTWEKYLQGWAKDVERRISERFGDVAPGDSGSAGGPVTGAGPAENGGG